MQRRKASQLSRQSHIQPDQLTKSRYFGGWSNNRSGRYLDRCHEQLEAAGDWHPVTAAVTPADPLASIADLLCEHCGSDRMELIEQTAQPSWSEVFWREDERCPKWYAARQKESHRRFWTESHGEDFYDWYEATQVEVAEGIEPPDTPPLQLPLFGFAATGHRNEAYLVDSF